MEDYNFLIKKVPITYAKKLSTFFSNNFDGNKNSLKKLFDYTLPNIPKSNFYVALKDDKIYGALVLVDRFLLIEGIKFKCCGLSYMAKDRSSSNSHLVQSLVNKVLQRSDNSTFSLGFASKKMDNFWYRYGFVGVDNFSVLTLTAKKSFLVETDEIKISSFTENSIDEINNIYSKSYNMLALSFKRSRQEWIFNFNKNKTNYKYKEIRIDKKLIGYIIFKKNEIVELSHIVKNEYFKKILFNYFFSLGYDEIKFHIPLEHPFIKFIRKFDHSLFYRKVTRGGHIIRINNAKIFCLKIRSNLENKIIELGINKYNLTFHGIDFMFQNKNLNIEFRNDFEENTKTKREITKLFFGLHNLDGIHKLIFDNNNVRFSILDQF